MSEMTTASQPSGFSKKWHGIPVWGWTTGAAAITGIGFWWWKKRSATAVPATAGTTANGTTTAALNNLQGQLDDMYGPGSTGYGTTSNGSDTVSVPDVTGLPQEQALQALTDSGLQPVGSPVIPGKILIVKSTIPKAGTSVANGSEVTLISVPGTYPTGGGNPPPPKKKPVNPGTVSVPEITGKDVEEAAIAVQGAGLKLVPHPKGVKGKEHIVVTQLPKGGSKAKKGSAVTITYKTVKS
jgi:hypothetical protein